MPSYFIKNAFLVNEGKIFKGNVLIKDNIINKIFSSAENIQNHNLQSSFDAQVSTIRNLITIDAKNNYLLPGIIDCHVHFREPGLTHKGDIYIESKSAVAGGITSFMEMPNTIPPATSQEILEAKYNIAKEKSLANYSFYLGATNDNFYEIIKTNQKNVCGIKIFMGSSTGDMLVDNEETLKKIFSITRSEILIAAHCEDEEIIRNNYLQYKEIFCEDIPVNLHPLIRSKEACYKSSAKAVELATKFNTRLHLCHISTADEIKLLSGGVVKHKNITAEVCPHHLWFDADDYAQKGSLIKCNPAIKEKLHKEALLRGLLEDKIDIIATDHAPHTLEEKLSPINAPSGIPSIQFSLLIMLELYYQKKISLEKIVQKMCHSPADCFRISKRGYIKEGYWADLVIVDLDTEWMLDKAMILSKCGWSPYEGQMFHSKVTHTFVNGNLMYENGDFNEHYKGMRLEFASPQEENDNR